MTKPIFYKIARKNLNVNYRNNFRMEFTFLNHEFMVNTGVKSPSIDFDRLTSKHIFFGLIDRNNDESLKIPGKKI